MRRRLLAIALACGLAAGVTAALPAEAAKKPVKPAPGKPCTQEGATYTVKPGFVLVCQRNAQGKLVWTKSGGPGPGPGPGPTPAGEVPAVIETWGVSVAPYDPTTKKAGDLYVGSIPFPSGAVHQAPIQYYGEGARRPQDPPDFIDPQMTFYVPIHTKVHAIVSGTVCWVIKLQNNYSDDYSVGVGVAVNGQPACQSNPSTGQGMGTVATWEHEHVMNPVVKVGDTVTAGQEIAEASYYSTNEWMYAAGYALYEIGVLTQKDNRPAHVCPALYLAPKVKETLLSQLATAARAYETNTGKALYSPQTLATGCITEKPSYG